MIDAHDAIVAVLRGGRYTAAPLERIRRPISHRQGLSARLAAIESGAGGERPAAAAAGVTVRTWRGWKRNPSARLAKRSREGVESAYQADWERRNNDPVRQLRFALAEARRAYVVIWAEMQWDGYYNGQALTVARDRPEAPLEQNEAAHRRVDFQNLDISPVVRAWKSGRSTREPMEELLRQNYSARIFLNSYFKNVSVSL